MTETFTGNAPPTVALLGYEVIVTDAAIIAVHLEFAEAPDQPRQAQLLIMKPNDAEALAQRLIEGARLAREPGGRA